MDFSPCARLNEFAHKPWLNASTVKHYDLFLREGEGRREGERGRGGGKGGERAGLFTTAFLFIQTRLCIFYELLRDARMMAKRSEHFAMSFQTIGFREFNTADRRFQEVKRMCTFYIYTF